MDIKVKIELLQNKLSFFLSQVVLEDDGEKIHQSNSFKRIMYSVLGQTDY